ncbi:MAG: hypothetical protein U9N18_00470 [Campylobacterota bacterium]|nr:hypothetical protein [Campylobacterota bacterium]
MGKLDEIFLIGFNNSVFKNAKYDFKMLDLYNNLKNKRVIIESCVWNENIAVGMSISF